LGNFLKIWESDEPDLISENEDEETDLIWEGRNKTQYQTITLKLNWLCDFERKRGSNLIWESIIL
jgi:hypothetical protein